MLSIISASLTRTRSVLMIFVLLLVSGAITYANIAKEANPDITIPMIYVSMVHDGISPEDVKVMHLLRWNSLRVSILKKH